ncbi:MAG: NUDIX domain-containing protein [Vicinamibacterales bacterium]
MPAASAGLLPYRVREGVVEVLLVHPGGPLWASRDAGAWSIPKGEIGPGEDALVAARREVREELGVDLAGPFLPLASVRQAGGKRVHAWAVSADLDPAALVSQAVDIEWPPRSGRRLSVPEVDRAAWFGLDDARTRILNGQRPLLDELVARLT